MKIGTLVKYKNLSTPSLPSGHHIGHKYGMIGIVTGQALSNGMRFYFVQWVDNPPNMEQSAYSEVRLEVISESR